MSLDIEKQSLATLREWAGLLGIRGVSALRKPDMVDLLTKVGEARIEYMLKLQQENAAKAPAPAEEQPAGQPEAAAKETAEESPAAEPAAADDKPKSRWTSISRKFVKSGDGSISAAPGARFSMSGSAARLGQTPRPGTPAARPAMSAPPAPAQSLNQDNRDLGSRILAAPIHDAPEDDSEISEPAEGTAARPRRRYSAAMPQESEQHFTSRGGFGNYAPSYRAQTEERERRLELRDDRPAPSILPAPPEKPAPVIPAAISAAPAQPQSPMEEDYVPEEPAAAEKLPDAELPKEDGMPNVPTGENAHGILEVMPDGFGFIRCENFMPGENDVYVAPSQIHRFGMKTGDVISGITKARTGNEKFAALLYINEINDEAPAAAMKRKPFEELTPIFPNERIHLETVPEERAMRIMDLVAPIGKGQRGMIVSQPKAGKTTLIKQVARAVTANHPDMHLIILLIDERPEEVTDIKEYIEAPNVEVIYSTFDETPEHHKRVAEMVLGRAQRLVEHGRDVMILLDSITRLARAYNLTVVPSGRTLSGGLDPAALHMPKKFFGAARNMREGGSLTILATALVETGSRLDDMVFEEFKGTGNMELVLDRKLSERRIFPAIDILRSGTRRDDLLLAADEQEAVSLIRQALGNQQKCEEALEQILDLMRHTKTNEEFCNLVRKMRF